MWVRKFKMAFGKRLTPPPAPKPKPKKLGKLDAKLLALAIAKATP